MTSILTHALVLTVDRRRRILTDGAIAFDDAGRLVAVDPTAEVLAAVGDGADVIDCRGRVIVPGFVDVHVHLGEQLMRGLVPDHAAPTEWLPEWLLPAYAAITPAEEQLGAQLAVAELLLTGTTTFCEAGTLMDWEPVADAVESAGIRGQLGRWTWDVPEGPERMRASTAEAVDASAKFLSGVQERDNPRLSASMTLLGMGTASDALLREAHLLAAAHDVPKAMMWAGTAPQHGGTPMHASQLAALGWTDASTKLTHAVYVDDEEVRIIAEGGAAVAHCPTAALRHVKGISRFGKFPEMLAAGTAVGLGGDSANGSNHFNMLRLAYLAATLYKDFRMDQRMIPPETALEMATLHGARCLGLDDQIGSLEPGKCADFVVFSTEHPEWRPMLNPVQNLILNASDRSIESVWVDGRMLVEHGSTLTIDLPAVLSRSDEAAAALLDRAGLVASWEWPSA